MLSDEEISVQRRSLRAQSIALQLDDGDERYVEVQIGATFSWMMMRWDLQSLRHKFSRLSLDQ